MEVFNCFPNNSVINVTFPLTGVGLAAPDWGDRAEFVEAFRVVLAQWPGQEAKELAKKRAFVQGQGEPPVEEMVTEVEGIAHKFYCQTFFDYFGRAPTIPHSVPI